MKKKIVFFLCKIKCDKLAYKISPSLFWEWKLKKVIDNFVKGLLDGINAIMSQIDAK